MATETIIDMEEEMFSAASVLQSSQSVTDLSFGVGDDKKDVRAIHMMVVAVIASANLVIGGLSPPGGVWSDASNGHIPGKSILATLDEDRFISLLSFNTFVFSLSLMFMFALTHKFPLYKEMWLGIVTVGVTYGIMVSGIVPAWSTKYLYVVAAAILPFAIRISAEVYIRLKAKAFELDFLTGLELE